MKKDFSNNNEVDFKKIFKTILRYKYSILLITTIITMLAFAYAYYKPNIYKSKASIQIEIGSKSSMAQQDILQQALSGTTNDTDIDTEISILQSRFLVLDAMKDVDVTTHIWGVNKFLKKSELYVDSPIAIDIEKGKGLMFTLTPVDEKHYKLNVKDGSTNKTKEYTYNETVQTDNYKLTISKTGKNFNSKYYKFIVYDANYYADELIKRIDVKQHKKKAKVLDITYTDTVALRAKEFVNAIARAYIKQNIELKSKDATKSLAFINSQLALIKNNLIQSEKSIEKFKTKEKTIDVKLSSERLSEKLSDLENQIGILNTQISVFQKAFNNVKQGKIDTLTLIGVGLDTKGIGKLVSTLQQAMLKKQELLKEYTPNHPEVQKLTIGISNLKRIIKVSISNTLFGLKQKEKMLKKQMAQYQEKLQKLPKIQQDYLALERKFTFNQKFYTYLLEKKTEAGIKKAATVSQNRIVDLALLPKHPIKPKRKLIIGAGFVFGLFLGLITAFVRNYFDNTIKNSEDIERETNVPIVATIPKFQPKKKDKRELIVHTKPKSSIAESFRSLRANLKFIVEKKSDNEATIITITSTVTSEGKTTIASNLALVLEMYGKKVIVVNFDLRKPTLHTVFDLPNAKGLSEYLSNQATLSEIIKHTKFKNLDIIPAGALPPNPSELIASKKVEEMFEELKYQYDYIVLDTPPIGLVSDTSDLLSISDIVLYVFRSDYSKKEFIKAMNKFHIEKKIKKLGVIINGVKNKDGYYGYGGYYGEYYEK